MGYRLWGYKYRSPVAITITQHILLWGSLCALIVAMNVLSVAYMDITLRPTAILMLISSLLSFGYLAFHNITARRKMLGFEDEESSSHMKRPSYIATRILIAVCTMWLITSGGNFIVAARQPVCLPTGLIYAYWQSGGPCVAQRAGTAIAILILIATCILFATIATSHNPFQSHLLGTSVEPTTTFPPPTRSMVSRFSFPMPPGYGKPTTPSHSHSNSITSVSSGASLPHTSVMTSRPLSTSGPGVVGLGISTPSDFPIEPPGTMNPAAMNLGSMSPAARPTTTYGSPSIRASTAYVAKSRPMTSSGQSTNSIYQNPRMNNSMSSLPGFTPLAPINRPTPSLISESQFKAIHPPAQHFRHVSTPFATASKQGTAIPFASIRALPQSRQLSLSGTRTPSLHSGYGYRTHKRSQSAGIIPTYPQPFPQAAPPNLGSSRSSSSGSASFPRSGLSHMRNASDPHAIIISQRRARDYDMAVRLEQKLAEVQARLERQQSQSTSSSDGKDARLPLPAPAPLLIKKSQSAVELRKSYVGGDLGLSVTEDVGAGFLMDDFAFGGEGAKTAKGEEERFLDAEEESVKSTSKVGEEVKNEDDKAIIREEGANDMDIS